MAYVECGNPQFWLHTDPMEPPHSHSHLMTSQLCHSASEPTYLCLYCIHLFLRGVLLVPEGSAWWITESSPRLDATTHGTSPAQLSGIRRWLLTFRTNSGVWIFYVSQEVIWDTTKGFWWRSHGLELDRWCGASRKIKMLHNQLSPLPALQLSQLDSLGQLWESSPRKTLSYQFCACSGQSSFCLDNDTICHPATSFFK